MKVTVGVYGWVYGCTLERESECKCVLLICKGMCVWVCAFFAHSEDVSVRQFEDKRVRVCVLVIPISFSQACVRAAKRDRKNGVFASVC